MDTFILNQIKQITDAYIEVLRTTDGDDEASYNEVADKARKEMLACINLLRDIYPEMTQVNMPEIPTAEYIGRFKERLRSNASQRYSLDFIPSTEYAIDDINNDTINTPTFIPWMRQDNVKQNFVIEYANEDIADAKTLFNALLLNILISLPPKAVKLNIFDLNMTGLADLFTVNLEPELYHDEVIVDANVAYTRIKSLMEHMAEVMKKYGNLTEYNNRNQEIVMPYEIVVLCGYPRNYDTVIEQLRPLFENGPRCGIFFIVLNDTDAVLKNQDQKPLLEKENYHKFEVDGLNLDDFVESNKSLIEFTPIIKNQGLLKVCFDYLREETTRVVKRATLKQDFTEIQEQQYEPVMSEISVTVGLDIEKKQEVTLRFNSGDYIHAFILGQSGSGKSVLLNNIITTAINKYSPEDLMLYLMDFKGVEFNRYRGVKHTKAVLVDNSDPQMTLEVLRELKEENKKRVKLWQQESVNNIDGYNKKHPDDRLPQVLFVADECQVMFSRIGNDSSSFAIQREISEIINIIATQGRSQGIHMLLATQQLDETDISGQVLKNLTECFLLMSAPSDSEKLVPDSSDLTSKQPTGQCCYYHKKELQAQVQTYYATDEELEEAINGSKKKAENHQSNGEAYFKGSSMFWFDKTEKDTLIQQNSRYASAVVGKDIGLKGKGTIIPLPNEYCENILFFGANKEEQTVGVVLNAMMSMMVTDTQLCIMRDYIVIDCYDNPDAKYYQILHQLEDSGHCRVVNHNNCGDILRSLCHGVAEGIVSSTALVIIGNERFSEIKRQSILFDEEKQSTSGGNDTSSQWTGDADGIEEISLDIDFLDVSGGSSSSLDITKIKTYPQALEFLLDEGPVHNVHTLLQVDKPANILFEGEFGRNATDKFRHKVILRSENKYLSAMRLSVEIDVEKLSDEEEHLRAYYYPEDGNPQLFTPYLLPDNINILND